MNIVQYLEHRGHTLKRASEYQLRTNCPLHPDTNPSFYVYLDDDHWHCFGCGYGGDILGLIWRIEFDSKPGRWAEITKYAKGLGVKIRDDKSYLPPPGRRDPDPLERKAMTISLNHYKEVLKRSPIAIDYLENRGIRNPLDLNLGYCADDPHDFAMLAHGLRKSLGQIWRNIAVSAGILWDDGTERMVNRIYVAEVREGEVIYTQGRSLYPESKKRYINPREWAKPLFGLESLDWDYPVVALVEGVFDALPFHSIHVPAVALLGSKMHSQIAFVRRLGNKQVAILTDHDEVGNTTADVILNEFKKAKIPAFRVNLNPYKDPGEWAATEGPEYLAATMCNKVRYDNS
jgi:DNA primase